jgi:lipopolysaccharide exporter
MVVLARLLAPDDFGVFAVGLIVLGFLEFLSEGGIEFALIREQAADREHYDSAWTLQILLGLFTAGVIVAMAPLVAYIFNEPRAELVVQLIALRPAFRAFNNIGVVTFLKEFDFRMEFVFDVARNLIDTVLTIVLALVLRDYMALVIGAAAGAALGVAFTYIIHPYRPRLSFKKIRDIWSFSGWLLVSYAAEEVGNLADRTVVGVIAASNVLGIFHMASTLSGVIMHSTIFPLWRGLFPAYSKMAEDPEDLARGFYSVFRWVVVVSCVAGFGVASVAPNLVVVMLGEKWAPAIPLVPWLACAVALNGVVDNPLLVVTALGRTRLCAIQSLIRIAMLLIALPIAGHFWGAQGVAIALFGVAVAHAPIPFYLLIKTTPVTIGDLIRCSWRPVVSSVAMFVVVKLLGRVIETHPALELCYEVAAGGAVFLAGNFLLWALSGRPEGPESTLIDMAAKRLRPRRSA